MVGLFCMGWAIVFMGLECTRTLGVSVVLKWLRLVVMVLMIRVAI